MARSQFDGIAATFDANPVRAALGRAAGEAMAGLDEEDGSFHAQGMHAWHNGFNRDRLGRVFGRAGFGRVRFSGVHAVVKPGPDGAARGCPVFLMTAQT